MKRLKLKLLSGIILAGAVNFPLYASLTNGSVTNVSATRSVAYTQPTTMTLSWSMLRFASAADPGPTVSSQYGRFTNADGSVVLGTVSKTLSTTRAYGVGSATFTFRESVKIPRDVLFKAYKQGIYQVYYRRDFTDCPGNECSTLSPTLSVSFSVTGSGSGEFTVSNYKLRFADGRIGKIIQAKEKLTAIAEITAGQSGKIKGVWEIASPATTSGQPSFMTLQHVNRLLVGGQPVRLVSPELPSKQNGIYLVRFRLITPALSETPPVIQYNVVAEKKQAYPSFNTNMPDNNTTLDNKTLFKWDAVKGAKSYKLFFLDKKPGENDKDNSEQAMAGIVLKSKNIQTGLPTSVRKKLKAGQFYWWQVQALDNAGNIIAKSEWKAIHYKSD